MRHDCAIFPLKMILSKKDGFATDFNTSLKADRVKAQFVGPIQGPLGSVGCPGVRNAVMASTTVEFLS